MTSRLASACALAAVILAFTGQAHALTSTATDEYVAYASVHQMGYDGSGTVIGVIDVSWPLTTHQTFYTSDNDTTSRVTRLGLYGGVAEVRGHSHTVASIAAGRGRGDGTYLGAAPGSEVWAASTDGEDLNIRQAFLDFSTPDNAGNRARVFVMSLAAPVADDGTLPQVKFMDWLAEEKQSLIAFAAGNDPWRITVPGGSYNHLTVGALDGTKKAVGTISGRGPTEDGRSKPDVVAPAQGLQIPGHLADDSWLQSQVPDAWTSVSTPIAAGVMSLVKQYGDDHGWTWDVRLTKSVIMNSAVKLPGWQHTDAHPLDDEQGAGRVNALRAIRNYGAGEQAPGDVQLVGWDLESINTSGDKTYTIDTSLTAGSVISATLNWFRHTNPLGGNELGYSWTVGTVNDLDLYLYRDSDCSLVAQSVSTLDNLEHIFFTVDQTDTYTLLIDYDENFGSETYALSWYTLIAGDANGDLKVDGADLAIWQQNYDPLGTQLTTWTMGDWNMDNTVDGADLALWQQNYDPIGPGILPTGGGGPIEFAGLDDLDTDALMRALGINAEPVPEPASLALVAMGIVALVGLRRKKNP